jgi:4'-phosphopantetheinyl transferase EntD
MPSWPSGYTGSITHADGYCLVAVASAEVVRSLGIDLERSDHVTPDLANLIQADDEGHQSGGFPLAAYFSAKEALFKCQYPLTREEAEFTDARIAFDTDGHFTVGVQEPRLELAGRCVGRVASVGPFVIAAAWLPCASTLSLDGGAIRI